MAKSMFLTLISDTMFESRYAKRTIETYLIWIKGFIYFHPKKHPAQMGDTEVEAYLNHLVINKNVAASEI
jgi:hypothetical protein